MPPPPRASTHTFLHDLLPPPPSRAGYAVTAESEPRLPVKAGTRAAAHPTAPVGVGDEPRRLPPRAVALRLWNDRLGVTDDPPIHAYRRGGVQRRW